MVGGVAPVDATDAAGADGARTIVLRSEPEGEADTIYRYDRAGLLMALKAAGTRSAPKKRAGRGK